MQGFKADTKEHNIQRSLNGVEKIMNKFIKVNLN